MRYPSPAATYYGRHHLMSITEFNIVRAFTRPLAPTYPKDSIQRAKDIFIIAGCADGVLKIINCWEIVLMDWMRMSRSDDTGHKA